MGAITDFAKATYVDGPGATPTEPTKADIRALFALVDAVIGQGAIGLGNWKPAVDLCATGNIALTGTITVDGVTSGNGKRILAPLQTSAPAVGIYLSNSGGAWTRVTDADSVAEMIGASVFVKAGTANANTAWKNNNTAENLVTLGTDAVTFVQIPGITAIALVADSIATAMMQDQSVTLAKVQNLLAQRLIGAETAGVPTQVFVGTGMEIVGGNLRLAADGVANSHLANMPEATFKMGPVSGTGDPINATVAQARTALNITSGADVTNAASVGSAIHGSAAKTTPVDADTFAGIDSASSNVLTKFTWANIKATLKTYTDTLYQPLATVLTNTTAAFTTAQETKLSGIEALADVTDAANVGSSIHGATAKTSLVDADEVAIIDSAASNVLKRITFANAKAAFKTYFDTLYGTVGNITSIVDTLTVHWDSMVKLTGAQTIAGVKTFSSAPVVPDSSFTLAKLQNLSAGRLVGAESAGSATQIAAGTGLEINTGNLRLADAGTTNAKLANMAEGTVKMRRAGAGTGAPTDTTLANLKADLSLDNVDNTSDATKNAAAATLTNKTLTAPVITSPTGIVKGDVGLGNVDNTSDAAKPVSTLTQSALDLKATVSALDRRFDGDVRRPGDSPLSFTTSLSGGDPSETAPLTVDDTTSGVDGRIVAISAARPFIALRALSAMEDGREYRLRYAVRRLVNSPDPANDAVTVVLKWYDQNKLPLAGGSASTTIASLTTLSTGSGLVGGTRIFGRASGGNVQTVAPAGAVYANAYVTNYGVTPQTAVVILDIDDTTDYVVASPDLSSVESRLAAQESIDAGDRLDAVEAAIGTPNKVVYKTMADALGAVSVDAGVDDVETLGWATVGDGYGRTYTRVGSQPAHPAYITIGGAYFESTAPREFLLSWNQSNGATLAHVWSPPKNLYTRNAGVASFAAASGTVISWPISFWAQKAMADRSKDFFVFNVAVGGMDISHWTGGLKNYLFDNGTADSEPTAGDIRLNHATPASVTEIYSSVFTTTGVRKFGAFNTASIGTPTITIYKASDPTAFVKYNIVTPSYPGSAYFKAVVTYHSSAGTIANNDPVRILISPDIYTDYMKTVVPQIYADLGITEPSRVGQWQIESDIDGSYGLAEYIADHESLRTRMLTDGLIKETTPWTVLGNAPYSIYPLFGNDEGNATLMKLVESRSDIYTFCFTGSLPVAFWDNSSPPGSLIHMNADGYAAVGPLAYRATYEGSGRSVVPGRNPGGTMKVRAVIADDGVVSYPLPANTTGFGLVSLQALGFSMLFHWDTWAGGEGVAAVAEGAFAALMDTSTSVLTGTTGTDTHFTVSVNSNKRIYLENRIGNTAYVDLFLFGA